MGVDHGLGGKDNKKSQQKREKRAKKQKAFAQKSITGGKKREVIFNENARVEYLTGFGKRKQERRKYGLAMEVLKKQKEHKEFIKEQRHAIVEATNESKGLQQSPNEDDDEDENEVVGDSENGHSSAEEDENVQVFADPSTVSMFGSAVSVVIDTNMEDKEETPTFSGIRKSVKSKQEPTRMEKALKKAKSMMGKKKKHKDNSFEGRNRQKEIKSKMESSKLLYKAVGGTYKGSKKKGSKRH